MFEQKGEDGMQTSNDNEKGGATSLLDLDINGLKLEMARLGEPTYRAKQVRKWLHRGVSFEQMTDLSVALREKLRESSEEGYLKMLQRLDAADGTQKYLLELADGNTVETVYLPKEYGRSVCVSTQVGCARGCAFCASCRDGLVRNLSAGEILAQMIAVNCQNEGKEVSHIVLMGMGEPLDNYANCLNFLQLVNATDGLNIGKRNISLSTCGITQNMYKLAKDFPGITLSISLHAPSQYKREKLMPSAKEYHISDILDAARTYFEVTGRRIIFEYAIIEGFNDSEADAKKLQELLRGINCHINIIPLNDSGKLKAPKKQGIYVFCEQLKALGLSATVRKSMGSEIEGACGQLRSRSL